MNKKIPLLTIALLFLFLMVMPQVMATQKESYYCGIEADQQPADSEQWNSGQLILHFVDHWVGTYDGTLGEGVFDAWTYMMLSFKTGKGTLTATWVITIPESSANTIAGSASGKVTAYGTIITGTFIGTDGTGNLEGVKKSGSFVMTIDAGHASMIAWGTIIGYP